MPDLGVILRKAREGAVLAGASGATGAGSKFPLQNRGDEAAEPGPGSIRHPGPPGPSISSGPGGPSLEKQPGPAPLQNPSQREQRLSNGGPGGPGGPSVKQHVCENHAPRPDDSASKPDVLSDTPRGWRDGLARLDRWTPPCEGFRSGEWETVHRAVSHFMDHYAAEAAARGWGAIDLFGVHALAGAARVDSCGALMLPLLMNATALTADTITFGPLVYRRRAMPEAVLVWDLVGRNAA